MPYTPPNFVDGTTPLNQSNMNSLGTQYSEAMQSFNQDLLAPYVMSGLVASRHNSYASNVLGSTPLQYFRLDETSGTLAADSSGNAQAGTYVASPTLNAAGLLTGDPDAAVTLNGTTQYATIPTTNLPTGANPWTMEAWVKPTNATNTNDGQICAIGDGGSNGRLVGINQPHTGGWSVFAWGGTVVSGGTSAAGVKHHIVGTFDGTNLRLYVDGALVAGPTAPGVTINVSGTHADIGALWNGTTFANFFNGTVDEVAIYGTALSAATITAHYNAGTTATTQVDLTSGVIVATQSDSTTRRRAISSTNFTTVTPSTTYYLYAQPDGTTYWNTANTPAANSLAIAQVTTDGSGNVSLVTDKRVRTTTLLPNADQGVFPRIVAQATLVNVTTTALRTLLTYTVPSKGTFRLSGAMTSHNTTANAVVTFHFTSVDIAGIIDAGPSPFYGDDSTGWQAMDGGHFVHLPANWGSVSMMPLIVDISPGVLTVTFQTTGTPNEVVSVIVERLA